MTGPFCAAAVSAHAENSKRNRIPAIYARSRAAKMLDETAESHLDDGYAQAEARIAFDQLIAPLDTRAREAMRLRFEHDLHQHEIAARLGVSQVSVSRMLRVSLEKLRQLRQVAVLVTDMRMPGMDGAQLLREVTDLYPTITPLRNSIARVARLNPGDAAHWRSIFGTTGSGFDAMGAEHVMLVLGHEPLPAELLVVWEFGPVLGQLLHPARI